MRHCIRSMMLSFYGHDVVDVGTNCATTLTVLSAFGIYLPARSLRLSLSHFPVYCVFYAFAFRSFHSIVPFFFFIRSVRFCRFGLNNVTWFQLVSLSVGFCFYCAIAIAKIESCFEFIRFIHKLIWLMPHAFMSWILNEMVVADFDLPQSSQVLWEFECANLHGSISWSILLFVHCSIALGFQSFQLVQLSTQPQQFHSKNSKLLTFDRTLYIYSL